MNITIPPEGSAVHVVYLESESKTLLDFAERETLGWLNSNTGKDIYIQHDRTFESVQNSYGSAIGIRIPIRSLVKICVVHSKESK
jgi:hypothetical protein